MAPAVKGQGDSWDRQGGCGVGCGSDPCPVWGCGVGRVRNALLSGNAWMQEGNRERAPRETADPGRRAGGQAQGQGALVESEVGLRRPVRSRHLPDVCCGLPCPAAGSRRGPSRAEGGTGWGSCQCKASWGDSPSRTWGEEQELQQGMCRHTGAPDPKDGCPLGPPSCPLCLGSGEPATPGWGRKEGCASTTVYSRGVWVRRHTHTLTLTEITETHMEITHTYGNHAATYTHTPAYTGLEVAEEPKAHLLRPTPHTPAPGQALASAPSLLPQPGWSPRRLPPAVPTAPSAHMRVVDLPRLAPNYP